MWEDNSRPAFFQGRGKDFRTKKKRRRSDAKYDKPEIRQTGICLIHYIFKTEHSVKGVSETGFI